jgi:hypothetical protein
MKKSSFGFLNAPMQPAPETLVFSATRIDVRTALMMSEASIAQALGDAVAHLSDGNLEQAEAALDVLEFERLLNPKQSRSKGPQTSLDPA